MSTVDTLSGADVDTLVEIGLDRLHAEEIASDLPRDGEVVNRADFLYREAYNRLERCGRCAWLAETVLEGRLGECAVYRILAAENPERFKLSKDVGLDMTCVAWEGEDEEEAVVSDQIPHKFSSTQFDLADVGYSRTQGSPILGLKDLSSLIADEDLAEDGKEDNFHVTIVYGL